MPSEPASWRLADRSLPLDRTRVMGVVNVTPDSFYDGGDHAATGDAIDHARELVEAGADLVDVGGESTRPGASPVPEERERRRVVPVVEALADETIVSVDTRKASVAEAALDVGAHAVNDVSALDEPGMADVVADAGAGLVLMHMQGTPETMQDEPTYDDVVDEIRDLLADRVQRAEDAGVPPDAICVDPGIGFGKTVDHNVEILARLDELRELGNPVLVGPSRKSFIGALADVPDATDRLPGTLAAVAVAAWQGADVVRVHDVAEARQALAVVDAVDAARRP